MRRIAPPPAVLLLLALAACAVSEDPVAGTCRGGDPDPAGRATLACAPPGPGDPVRIVIDATASWPVFLTAAGPISAEAGMRANAGAFGTAPPVFDPRRDEVLWPRRETGLVTVTFATIEPRRARPATVRVLFQTETGAILGYRRIPRG